MNVFSCTFNFQTKLSVMRLQEDGSAKSKQIWTILSHWNIRWFKVSLTEKLLFFYNAKVQLVRRDIVAVVIYYYIMTEFLYSKRDFPLSEYGGVNIEVSYFSVQKYQNFG